MRVIVRAFARLREELGLDRLVLELPDDTTLKELLNRLLSRQEHLMVAVNGKLLPQEEMDNVRLREGDVVDLMPPASGG